MKRDVKVPEGNYLVWGGEFENQKRALARLAVIVPFSFLVVFVLLFMALGSVGSAFSVLLVAPLAMSGGVLGLAAAHIPLSVSAAVGFIALLGQVCLASLLVVSAVDQRRRSGEELLPALVGRRGEPVPHGADDGAAGDSRTDAGRAVVWRGQRDAAAVRRGHHQRSGDGRGGHAVRAALCLQPHRPHGLRRATTDSESEM